jgi:hypothetical protein
MTALISSTDLLCHILFLCQIEMPRPRVDLDAFRDKIERRITSKHTHRQIRSWLAGKGFIISKGTLQSRCVAWETTRQTRTAGTNTTFVKVVEKVFHTTNYSDQTIADNIIT